MDTRILRAALVATSLYSFTLAGCGNVNKTGIIASGPDIPIPESPYTVPSSVSGGVVPIQSPEKTCYLATTGGCFTVEKVISSQLASNQKLKGFSIDGGTLYALIREDQGAGIVRWRIWRTALTSSGWDAMCDILDDGAFHGGLAASNTSFYTFGSTCEGCTPSRQDIRVFNHSCVEQNKIVAGRAATTSYYDGANVLSYSAGQIYYPDYYSGFDIYRISDFSFPKTLTSVNLGSRTFAFGSTDYSASDLSTFSSNGTWGIQRDYSETVLWSFDSNYRATGWAQLPTNTYPLLDSSYLTMMGVVDPNTVIAVSLQSDSFRLYVLNVSQFASPGT